MRVRLFHSLRIRYPHECCLSCERRPKQCVGLMNLIVALKIAVTLGIPVAFAILLRARNAIRRTTLTTAWGWGIAGLSLWTIGWVFEILPDILQSGVRDQIWYAASVVMLCPFIAVLGAKRPTSRTWTGFVLVPLLLVLGWPALTAWDLHLEVEPLQLEAPAFLAFCLVLVMALGNYLGTRFGGSSLLLGIALLLNVLPFWQGAPFPLPSPATSRLWGTSLLVVSFALAARNSKRQAESALPLDRLWNDFRDFYGIVWSKRILDRINDTAETEQWPARLEMHGLVWIEQDVDDELRAKTRDNIEQKFRWLLRRFADPAWIDERLKRSEDAVEITKVEPRRST